MTLTSVVIFCYHDNLVVIFDGNFKCLVSILNLESFLIYSDILLSTDIQEPEPMLGARTNVSLDDNNYGASSGILNLFSCYLSLI